MRLCGIFLIREKKFLRGREEGGGGYSHMKKTRGLAIPFRGVKPQKVRSWGVFTVPFRVHMLSCLIMTGENMLCKNLHLIGEKKNLSHGHRTGSWYLLGVLFKFSDECTPPFYVSSLPLQPPPPPPPPPPPAPPPDSPFQMLVAIFSYTQMQTGS